MQHGISLRYQVILIELLPAQCHSAQIMKMIPYHAYFKIIFIIKKHFFDSFFSNFGKRHLDGHV